MKKSNSFVVGLGVVLFTITSVVNAISVPENSKVVTSSPGFAFAIFGNGAAFSWANYVAPIIKINQNGSSTNVTTTAGYFKNSGTSTGKFVFQKDMSVWSSMNKINPDIVELQKVMVAEGLLSVNVQTGVYDNITKSAVEAFQKKYGIKPAPQYSYGYFGPITRGFINKR